MKPKTTAILLAGGKGLRMGDDIPKQFLPLAGRPVVLHSLEKFEGSDWVHEIVLVLPEGHRDFFKRHVLKEQNFSKLKKQIVGGITRQDSSYEGFKSLDSFPDVVIVHDVARPLVSSQVIEECIRVAYQEGASLAAKQASDTIKECDKDGKVLNTHDRKKIFIAQTPQAFRYEILKKALESAYEDHFQGTDEASLVERIGHPVKVVATQSSNIKLTQPEDFLFAEAILKNLKLGNL